MALPWNRTNYNVSKINQVVSVVEPWWSTQLERRWTMLFQVEAPRFASRGAPGHGSARPFVLTNESSGVRPSSQIEINQRRVWPNCIQWYPIVDPMDDSIQWLSLSGSRFWLDLIGDFRSFRRVAAATMQFLWPCLLFAPSAFADFLVFNAIPSINVSGSSSASVSESELELRDCRAVPKVFASTATALVGLPL